MSFKKYILLRIRIAFLFVFLFCGAIIYRVVIIQYVEKDEWMGLGEANGLKVVNVNATRGNIYSDNGSLLATSLPFYRVAFDPSLASDGLYKTHIDSLCYLLADHFKDLTPTQYRSKIDQARNEDSKYLVLNRKEIGYQQKKEMQNWPIFRMGQLKGGVIFETVEKRFMPFNHLGGRTIGTVNGENRGIVGLEYSYNRQLAGKNGEAIYQKMVGGGWKPLHDGATTRADEGYDIETTLNVNLQDITESALLKALVKHRADYGVAVVMEVKTGAIKAMSNLSRNDEGQYYERYNYAVGSQGSREPGSTFKLASMIALLEDSDIKLSDSIDTGNGELQFFNETMRDHKKGGYGKLTVQEVFEYSSNIGVAKLVTNHFNNNPQRFIDILTEMGISQPLGFQMVGEGKPYIKSPSDSTWSGTTLPWMSHGYELKMTPLQTLTLYNAVANNGKMIQPIIVKSIRKADKVIDTFESRVLNPKICSKSTLRDIKIMLQGTVERGTANNIYTRKYTIAGKTGTAKRVKNGKYTNEYYTSFAGYFPANDPKYSCIVVIDNPKGYQIYGADVSAPVFKEIADKIYATEVEMHEVLPKKTEQFADIFPVIKSGMHDDLSYLCNELGVSNHSEVSNVSWVKTEIVGNSVFWNPNTINNEKVPDVRGMTLKDAIYVLENAGLKVNIDGRGRVREQSITPGSKIIKNYKIKLTLG